MVLKNYLKKKHFFRENIIFEGKRDKTHLICSLIAASLSLVNFWRARETCGRVGTSSSSFFTSSNGSKTTPVSGRLFAFLDAQTTTPPSFLVGGNRRIEFRDVNEFRGENEYESLDEDKDGAEENRGPKFSPRVIK